LTIRKTTNRGRPLGRNTDNRSAKVRRSSRKGGPYHGEYWSTFGKKKTVFSGKKKKKAFPEEGGGVWVRLRGFDDRFPNHFLTNCPACN